MASSILSRAVAATIPSPREGIVRPTLWLVAGRVGGGVAAFAMPIVLVRLFDQTTFGTYRQLFLLWGTVHSLAQLGMAECLYYFLPASPNAGRFAANSLLALGMVGALAAVLLAVARAPIAMALSNPALAHELPLLAPFLMLMLASSILEIVMIAQERSALAAIVYAGSDVARAVLLVGGALAGGRLETLLVGATLFGLARFAVTIGYLTRSFGTAFRLDLGLALKQLAWALPFAAAVGLETMQGQIPQYIVAHRVDAATFAIFSVGCMQIPLVDQVACAAGNVLMVRLSEDHQNGRSGNASLALWHETIGRLAQLFFPLAACAAVASRDLVTFLFTPAYAASAPLLALASAGVALAAFPTDAALRSHGATRFIAAQSALKLVLAVVGALFLLPRIGLSGAIVAMVLATAAGKTVSLLWLRRHFAVRLPRLLPWRALGLALATAAAGAAPALVVRSFVSTPILALVGEGLVFLAVWLSLTPRAQPKETPTCVA